MSLIRLLGWMEVVVRDPVTEYAARVLEGELIAGPAVIHACERHFRDLQRDDIYLDLATVAKHLKFFSLLKHWEGRWAGRPIVLEPWQEFIQGSIFGWKRRVDGLRRFREALVEVARKNGKSPMGAGTGLYGLSMDGEHGAQVYAVATKRAQAKIVWKNAEQFVKRSPALRKRINCFVSNLSMPSTGSKFETLGRDSDTEDGLNVHMGIIDELHAWKERLMWSQVEDAMGARSQPLIYSITTAGVEPESLCFEKIEHAIKVLNPLLEYEDDTLFAYIATVDDSDLFDDPKRWAMANPNMGVSKSEEYMATQYAKALQIPSRMVDFKVKHLNIWSNAATAWLDLAQWKRAEDADLRMESMVGLPCYMGLDLGETNDLSAVCDLFIGEDDVWYAFFKYWCPEEDIRGRVKLDRVPYEQWRDAGYLVATPGNATDFDFIEAAIREAAEFYQVKELLYDKWKSHLIVPNLLRDEVVSAVGFNQNAEGQHPALREIERRLLNGKLKICPDPVTGWCASNAEVITNAKGLIKLNKRDARKRIDGMAALANAVGGALLNDEKPKKKSPYSERGMRSL